MRTTLHVNEVRVTRLDDAGLPTNDTFTLPVSGFTLTTNEGTTTMTTVPAPRKGSKADLEARLAAAERLVLVREEEAEEYRREQNKAVAALGELDLEARLIGDMVAAVEAYHSRVSARSSRTSNGYAEAARYNVPTAFDSPVGRALLNVAQRYGVPLGVLPIDVPPTLEDEGMSLTLAPTPLSRAIDQLVAEHYGDLRHVRPR